MFFANVKYKELVSRRKPCMCLNVCSVSAVSLYGAALGPQLATPSTKRFPDTFESCRRTVGSPLCLKRENVMTRKGHNDICSENIICKICNIKNMLSTFLEFGWQFLSVPFTAHPMRGTESVGTHGAQLQCGMKTVREEIPMSPLPRASCQLSPPTSQPIALELHCLLGLCRYLYENTIPLR